MINLSTAVLSIYRGLRKSHGLPYNVLYNKTLHQQRVFSLLQFTVHSHKQLPSIHFQTFLHFIPASASPASPSLLGGSGGVVNSLDFCPASLKSLGCFYFRCVLSSQWKAVTVNLRILHCQLYRHIWRPVVIICLAISNNLLLML